MQMKLSESLLSLLQEEFLITYSLLGFLTATDSAIGSVSSSGLVKGVEWSAEYSSVDNGMTGQLRMSVFDFKSSS